MLLGELEHTRYENVRQGPRFHDFGPGVKLVGGTRGHRTVTVSPDLWTPRGPWLVNRGDGRKRLVAQSVLFDRLRWSESRARSWLKRQGYRAGQVEHSPGELRFRQLAPGRVARGSFRTVRFGQGVEAVMGHTRNPAGLAIFTNPGNRKGHAMARRHHKRPVPAGFSSWRAYMAHIRGRGKVSKRRHRGNPVRRHARSQSRAVARRNPESRAMRRRAARRGGMHRSHRRNPASFFAGLLPAYLTSLGVTFGKATARGVIPLVLKKNPTGLVGLGSQTLVGGLVAWGVSFVWPKIGADMLVGTFENLNESLLRTPITIGGQARPIPFFGTALSDYREAYRLAGYSQRPSLSDYRTRQLAPMVPGANGSTVRGKTPVSAGRKMAVI